MTDELTKTLNNPDAERALLGLAMSSAGSKALDDIELDAGDFADMRHEQLWALIMELRAEGKPTDGVTVNANLHRLSVRIDGGYLPALIERAPLAPWGHTYASIIANAAMLRRRDIAAGKIKQLAAAGGDGQDIAETAVVEVAACQRARTEIHMVKDSIDQTLDELEKPSTAVPTPWPDLNRLIKGWRPGALYVVAARPAVGKSIIGLQAAFDLAQHGTVGFVSLEMPRQEVTTRLIAQVAEVQMSRLNGTSDDDDDLSRLSPDDWAKIARSRHKIEERPLAIEDRSYLTVNDIRSYARTLARKGPLAGLFVDYLQLVSPPRGERRPRHEVVAEISRSLKILAKELGCPVIALSQLNRQSEARTDKRPTMADIRESGAIEQDADVILLLHMDEQSLTDLDLIVAKNRQGRDGIVDLYREGHFARATPRPWSPTSRVA